MRNHEGRKWLLKTSVWITALLMGFALFACTTTTETPTLRKPTDPPHGFFEKMVDEMTSRECNVGKFTCSYGLGPASEPCECTDPSVGSYVLVSRT